MIRNYIKTVFRNILKNKFFFALNVVSLAIGLSAIILIITYLKTEYTYDNFHELRERMYRINLRLERENEGNTSGVATAGIAPAMYEEFPEIETYVRFRYPREGYYLTSEGKNYDIPMFTWADSTLFDVFSFKLLKGNPMTALSEPDNIVLSESMAKKIFPNEEAMNKILSLNHRDKFKVSGIMKDIPKNSQLKFDAVGAFGNLRKDSTLFLGFDGGHQFVSYLLLKENTDTKKMEEKFPDFMERKINHYYRKHGLIEILSLQKLQEIHLNEITAYDLPTRSNVRLLKLFSTTALIILIIACINYINISTSGSFKRSKEVGIRKVNGATKRLLIWQFLSESILTAFFALILALILTEIIQPGFNQLVNADLSLYDHSNLILLPVILIIAVLVGILAGIYPSFIMAGFVPVKVLKAGMNKKGGKKTFRNILVVFQFIMSSLLIICTLAVYSQIKYMKDIPKGFATDHTIVIPLKSDKAYTNVEALKKSFMGISGVSLASATTGIPGKGLTRNGYLPEGVENTMMIHVMDVDCDYIDLIELPIVKGKGFEKDQQSGQHEYIINETLADMLGWDNPIGKTISRGGKHKVIGVVRDFMFFPAQGGKSPLIITNKPWDHFRNISVKYSGHNTQVILKELENKWKEVVPLEDFDFYFMNDYIDEAYEMDTMIATTVMWFAALSILIACLGLLGLAAFTAQQKRKETGIRKVLGADEKNIIIKNISQIGLLVLLGNIVAWPLAWMIVDGYLQNYANRASISPWLFITTLLAGLAIACITVIFQMRKLAKINPAQILKYE